MGPLWPMTSLVAQMVKNPPSKGEIWVQSLSLEGSLEEEMATQSSILAWETPWTEEPGWAAVHGAVTSKTQLSN